jgi:ABC-2 type transport system ATP-binding protein
VRIDGFDVDARPREVRRRFGYLPETAPLYGEMRVEEFLLYRARIKGVPRRARAEAVASAMARCGVAEVRRRRIGHLSKGYRQRTALAETLLAEPPLLVLDEPTAGLDPNQVLETRALIRDLGRTRTVFLSSHLLAEVETLCDRVLILHDGRLVAGGAPQELARRFGGARRIRLTFAGPVDARALAEVAGVASLTPRPEAEPGGGRGAAGASAALSPAGARCWVAEAAGEADPRGELVRFAAREGWILEEMRREPVRLETVFARLTASPGAPPASQGAEPPGEEASR